MSTENKKRRRRPYTQRLRADRQEQTRLRITEAVVALHERVGPARTTISEVAELAGVGRMTVYKHFPSEADLFRACGAHWSAQHPPPDFGACLAMPDPVERMRCVLERLYAYYRETHGMMGKILRDAPLLPALQEIVESGWAPLMRGLVDALLPQHLAAAQRRRARAAAHMLLDLRNWETLTAESPSDEAAAALAADLYRAALETLPSPRGSGRK